MNLVEDSFGAYLGGVIFVGEAAQCILKDHISRSEDSKGASRKGSGGNCFSEDLIDRGELAVLFNRGGNRTGFGFHGFARIVTPKDSWRGILRDNFHEEGIGTILRRSNFVY